MAEIKQKINLAKEMYVHYNEQNYITYRNKYIKTIIDWKAISLIYRQWANTLKRRMMEVEKLTNSDNQSLVDALGMSYDLANGNIYSEMEKEILIDLPNKLRQGKGYAMTVAGDINQLDKFLSFLKDVINRINNLSSEEVGFLQYLLKQNKQKSHNMNINSMFSNLNVFSFNKTTLTSIESLKKRAMELEKQAKNLKKSSGILDVDGKKYSYSNYVFGISQLFVNILGGLGEGVGAAYAEIQINKFLQSLKQKGFSVEIRGSGTEKLDNNSTKKADYEINIDSENGKIKLSFGVSAKAQNLKGAKGRKVATTFGTTQNLGKWLKTERLKVEEKYVFYNTLYFGKNNDKERQFVNRKIAALNAFQEIAGGNGENVLFIQYLDDIIRLDEFFESLAQKASNGSNIPTLRVMKSGLIKNSNDYIKNRGSKLNNLIKNEEGYKDLDNNDKNILAFVRARQIINKINNLEAQLRYEH